MEYFEFTLFILSIGYFLFLLICFFAIFIRKHKRNEQYPYVSVLICARNEEAVLPKTLSFLEKLDYPNDKLEFIMVDHASTDGTKNLFDEFASKDPQHRKVIHIPEIVEGLLGKAAPWHCGMLECNGEIVLTTGADCFVPPSWVKQTLSYFTDEIQIVSGPAFLMYEDQKNTIFDRVQNVDMLFLQGLGYAVNSLGMGGAGLANNFAIRRSAYSATGGFPKLGFSICEDVRLSQGVRKKFGNKAIRYHFDRKAIPITNPEPFKKLPNMKIRWSMGMWRLEIGLKLIISLVFLLHLLLPVYYIFTNSKLIGYSIFLAVFGEMLFSFGALSLLKRWKDLIAIPVFIVYFWFYTTFVAPWVLFRIPLKWKGLKVREPLS